MSHPGRIRAVFDLRPNVMRAAVERERHTALRSSVNCPRIVTPFIASLVAILVVIGLTIAPAAPNAQARTASAASMSPEEAANVEIARRFFAELHDRGDLGVAEEIIAPDAAFHIPGGELTGPEGIGGLVTTLRTAFPDAVFPMEDVVVEGDTVAVRWTMRGTSQRAFQGIPPTGQPVELRGTAFLTLVDGQIVEDWVTYDQLSLLRQLGAVPSVDGDRTCVAHSKAESSCQ